MLSHFSGATFPVLSSPLLLPHPPLCSHLSPAFLYLTSLHSQPPPPPHQIHSPVLTLLSPLLSPHSPILCYRFFPHTPPPLLTTLNFVHPYKASFTIRPARPVVVNNRLLSGLSWISLRAGLAQPLLLDVVTRISF